MTRPQEAQPGLLTAGFVGAPTARIQYCIPTCRQPGFDDMPARRNMSGNGVGVPCKRRRRTLRCIGVGLPSDQAPDFVCQSGVLCNREAKADHRSWCSVVRGRRAGTAGRSKIAERGNCPLPVYTWCLASDSRGFTLMMPHCQIGRVDVTESSSKQRRENGYNGIVIGARALSKYRGMCVAGSGVCTQ